MKLGGMMMRLAAYDYLTAAARRRPRPSWPHYWRPYIETCIELFGAKRCMFESNFPVEKMGIGYAALWNAFKRIAAGASADEKLAIFSGTAAPGVPARPQKDKRRSAARQRPGPRHRGHRPTGWRS